MTDQHPLTDEKLPEWKFNQPEISGWKCYMFGNRPGGWGITYFPEKGQVPNRFVRFMMRVCFDCLWVKEALPDD